MKKHFFFQKKKKKLFCNPVLETAQLAKMECLLFIFSIEGKARLCRKIYH